MAVLVVHYKNNTTPPRVSIKQKKLMVDAFLDAAIAYELQSNWRSIFKYYSKQTMGALSKRFKQWSIEEDVHFNNAIKIFLKED